jgi:DNA polymerase type B, organellar and viral
MEYPKDHPLNQTAKLLQNSLYGKFGMKDDITIMEILENTTPENRKHIEFILDVYNSSITDILDLENHTLLIRKSSNDLKFNKNLDFYHGSDVNVAIASAITAEARIFMSQFKNDPTFKLYYSDTDSIVVNKPLPDHMVGNALGQLKLEYIIKKAVFLAPKVYAFITDQDQEIIKVKGLTKDVIDKLTFKDLEALLIKDSSREFNQNKWFKSIIEGEISTHDMIYTLKSTANKRNHIYVNGIFNSTKPYNYKDISKNDKA